MWLKILILASLSTGFLFLDISKPKHDCKILMEEFITNNTRFLKCVVENNQNGMFCLECTEMYSGSLLSFNLLLNETETNKATNITTPCRTLYIDNNQLDLVEGMFANSKRIWNAGYCSDCINASCNLLQYTEEECGRSKQTMDFVDLHQNTTECMELYPKDLCKNCTAKYDKLNGFYNTIRLKTEDKFCFAVKDMMNKTRSKWAEQCCENRQASESDFYLLSSFSIAVSISFYVVAYIIGRRKERVQEIPNDLMPPVDLNESNRTIMNIQTEGPSTENLSEPNLKIIPNGLSSSDDEDDDILPIQNPNLIQID